MEEKYFVHGAVDRDGNVEHVTDEEAKFWTVYKNFGSESYVVFDCCTRLDAEAAAALLNTLSENKE